MEDGTLVQLLCAVGDTVPVDQPIAIICEEEASMKAAAALRKQDIPPATVLPRAMWQAYKRE